MPTTSSESATSGEKSPIPPIVTNAERVRALHRYNILDTEQEEAFDTLVELAADLFDVPEATVSFIDADRQWFKSRVNGEESQIGLEHSFCVHTLEREEVVVVEDLSKDHRFRDNPYVKDVGFRFYAAAPLVTPEGYTIGTLCLLDTEPRPEPARLRDRLPKLASLVVDELELRRENERRRQAAQRHRTLFEEAGEAILVHDAEGNILRANKEANSLFGSGAEALTGQTLFDLHPEEASAVPRQKLRSLREGRDYHVVTEYVGAGEQRFWGSLTATVVEIEGETMMRSLIRDVTERRRTERLQKIQANLLEQVASGRPAEEVLSALARFVESELQQVAVSVLTLEEDRLYHTAGPSLPEQFVRFIDGVEWGPSVGSCGTAAFTGEVVVTDDIRSDERWEGYREIAADAGFRSCWSYPIVGSDDGVLGTFATYGYEPGTPTVWEKQLLCCMSHVASVALERDRREANLQKNRQLLQLSQELAGVGGWEYDIESGKLQWTDEVYRIHDLPVGTEIDPEEAIRFYAPGYRRAIRQAFDRLLEKGEEYDLELRLMTAKGEQRWVRAIGVSDENDEKRRHLRGAVQDVTDQKETRQELRAKKALLRTIFDEAPVMVALFGASGSPQLVNQRVEDDLGWTQEDVEQDPAILQRLFPEPEIWKDAHRFILQAQGGWKEFPVQTKSGTEKPILVTTSRLPDGRRIGIGVDVSEKKERERRLRLLEAAVEHSTVPVLITEAEPLDRPGPRIAYANPAFTDVSGYAREEAKGKSPRFLQGEDTDREALGRIREALEKGEPVRETILNYTKDGAPYWNDIYMAPVRNETGEVTHFVSIQNDVTEQVRRREELKEAKEEAEEAARIKSALLSNMNHEFRTPLTSIISFSELISDDPSLAETFADRILGGGKRLLYTLNTVMDFAELEGEQAEVSPRRLDVREVARSVASEFRGHARRKDLTLEVDAPERVVVASDAYCVERICTHLLSNAIKFTDEGGASLSVRQDGEGAVVEVSDTGIGIPPDARPQVFDEFFQASTGNDRTHEGNGLGLTIVKRLLGRIDGSVELESTPGKGTRVTVRIPALDQT